MAPRKKIPSFFKGMLFRENTQRLRLPKAFGPYLDGRLPGNVFLRNRYRDLWPMEIARSETGEYAFEKGWPRFVEHNKLEFKDFLIFQYDVNSIFDFKIYGKDMDEKEYTRFPEVKPDPDDMEQTQHHTRQLQQPRKKARPRPRQKQQRRPEMVHRKELEPVRELEQEIEREPEPNDMEQPRKLSERHQSLQRKKRRPEAVQCEEMVPEQELEQTIEQESGPEKVEKLQQPRHLQQQLRQPQHQNQRQPEVVQYVELRVEQELDPEVELEDEPMEVDDEEDGDFLFETEQQSISRNMKRRKRRKRVADENVVFESGDIHRPDIPYFVMQRGARRNELYIPKDLVAALDLDLLETLQLRDQRNRNWLANVRVRKDGKVWLSRGWKNVCKRNNVKMTDMCLCEFIPATQEHDMFLKIRVIPNAALRRPT